MCTMKISKFFLISSLLVSLTASAALEDTWTVGGGAGWAHAFDHTLKSSYVVGGKEYSTIKDFDGIALKLYGERNFKEWFGLGLGYNYIYGQHLNFKCYNCGVRMSMHTHIAELYTRFAYPYDDKGSDVFFKLGPTYNWHHFLGETHHRWGGVAGVGVQYAFTKAFGVRGGYDYFYRTAEISNPMLDKDVRLDQGVLYLAFQYTWGGSPKTAPVAKASSNRVTQLHTLNADILFPFDSYTLSAKGKEAVSTVINSANELEDPEFEVYGYTDRMGSDAYNQTLSQNRANSVSEEFANNGVKVKVAEGKGKNPSVTGNKCDAVKGRANVISCLQPDRRVEVLVSGQKVTK